MLAAKAASGAKHRACFALAAWRCTPLSGLGEHSVVRKPSAIQRSFGPLGGGWNPRPTGAAQIARAIDGQSYLGPGTIHLFGNG